MLSEFSDIVVDDLPNELPPRRDINLKFFLFQDPVYQTRQRIG